MLRAVCLFSVYMFCDGARILGIVPTPSYSHQVVFRPIWNELANRGHDIVVITTDPQNNPDSNIKEIDINFAYQLWRDYDVPKIFEKNSNAPYKLFQDLQECSSKICDAELSQPEVQEMIHNETEHFDLLIIELTYTAMFAFAERFKCPYIGVTTLDLISSFHSILGNPNHPAAYPDMLLPFDGQLSFTQRFKSFLVNVMAKVSILYSSDAQEKLIDKHFGVGMPGIVELIKKASMVFINEDPAFYRRPLGPAFVPIGGGTHLDTLKPLPENLQKFMDDAEKGIIYFSLGTNIRSEMIEAKLRRTFLDAFRELPYKVLWKFDVTDIPDVPEHVKILKWLPQQDVLRHPNVKLFIFQGGLQSFEEAVFSNVPVVVIPFLADQEFNAHKIEKNGYGLYLNRHNVTQQNFKEAILEAIKNPKYKQRITDRANISKDQPMTGLEKAIWWTEYVIRHKGAEHFRNPMVDLPTYQYYLLDIIGCVICAAIILCFIMFKLLLMMRLLLQSVSIEILCKKIN